jgi:hypothetical protein
MTKPRIARKLAEAAEMKASLLGRQCLGKRHIPDLPTLVREIRAWRQVANARRHADPMEVRVKDARRVFWYDRLKSRRSEH